MRSERAPRPRSAENAAKRPRLDALDRRIIGLAVPALGSLVVEPLYNLTDSAIVGHLGKYPLGGLAVASAGLNVLSWVAAFIQMATVSAVSFRKAAGDDEGAERTVGAAYALSLVVGVGIAVFLEVVAPYLAEGLGGHAHGLVLHDAIVYLRITAVGLPMLLVALAGTGHLMGLADTKRPLVIAVISNVANVVLELFLVYGLHLGIAGSAWGTVVAQFLAAVLFVACSARAAARPRRPGASEIRALLADAVPLTVRTVALGTALLMTTFIAARLGTAPLGGHQIAMQVWSMLALSLDALAVPAQVYVSESLGHRDVAASRLIGRRTMRMGVVLGTGLGVATMALSPVLPAIFSADPAVQHQGTLALLVCGLQQPVAAGAFVLDGLILGAAEYGVMRRAMLLALLAFAPLAALTLAFHSIGITGIWFAMLCWLVACTLLLGRRWTRIVGETVPALG